MCVGLFLASIRRQRVSRTCFVVPFTQIHTPPPLFPFSFRGRGIRIDVFALTFRSFPNPPSSPLFVSLFFVAAATPFLAPGLIPRGRGIGAPPSRRPSNPTRSKEAGGKGEGRRGGPAWCFTFAFRKVLRLPSTTTATKGEEKPRKGSAIAPLSLSACLTVRKKKKRRKRKRKKGGERSRS